ncbi:ATP-dependent DNA ligase [Klebsiella phage vB_KpnM_KB57]|uniref:DNA ligase n=1 Tax=Klebsiella phage vB_KpnM_KB57 TaxID=1719140 RepID=A0A0S1S2Y2_9CAUD|nr:ATP-dependent DNA ligase [Klebsiella phage vB_KpnM_KB57]ALM02495.1 putative ATP-dependent DNA ligase [Klebsiella phage vB_KpnM_KB57]
MQQVNSTLYALNKDGSFQCWKVFIAGNQVVVEFGKVGGKKQQKVTTCEPKNVGRSNETTAEQQALAEAVSKWEKQVRLGYRDDTSKLEQEENFSPMLAHDATKRSKSIVYPAYVQPKLDGVRALVTLDADGFPQFNSRGNKLYPVPLDSELSEQVKSLSEHSGFDKFDGELYIHGLSLQKIVALAKKWRTPEQIEEEIEKDYQSDLKRHQKAIDNGEDSWKDFDGDVYSVAIEPVKDVDRYGGYSSLDLEYHIFDIPCSNKPWMINDGISDYTDKECRYKDLMDTDHFTSVIKADKINVVQGNVFDTEDEVKQSIGHFMQQGFEGAIIRNFKGVYEFGQRSSDLQKWKLFQDGEAKVLDSVEDKNGEGVLLCEEKDGTRFNCKMKGTHAERSQERMLLLVGKFINFTFQARTDDGVPQFPVGQSVRELDTLTWEPVY